MEGELQPTEDTGAIPQAAPGAKPVVEKSGPLHALGLKLRAFPVFDLRRGMASTFFCVPAKIASDGNAFGHLLLSNLSDASRAEVDIELLRAAITYATRYDEAQKVAAIGTAVSFSTLTNVSTRKAYLAGFAAARDLRAPLVVKIELIPTGTPPLRFAELVAYLKAVVSRVFVSVPDLKDPKWHLGQLGAAGIGVMVNPDDGADVVIEKARILGFLCAKQGAVPFMDGLVLPEAAKAAAAAGIRFGTGPALSLMLFPLDGGLPKVPLAARE